MGVVVMEKFILYSAPVLAPFYFFQMTIVPVLMCVCRCECVAVVKVLELINL